MSRSGRPWTTVAWRDHRFTGRRLRCAWGCRTVGGIGAESRPPRKGRNDREGRHRATTAPSASTGVSQVPGRDEDIRPGRDRRRAVRRLPGHLPRPGRAGAPDRRGRRRMVGDRLAAPTIRRAEPSIGHGGRFANDEREVAQLRGPLEAGPGRDRDQGLRPTVHAALSEPQASPGWTTARGSPTLFHVTLRLFLLMVVRGATYGAIAPFASVLAIRAGLPVALVGPLAAAGAVLTLLSAQAWGRYGDRLGRRRVLVAAFLLGAPAAAGQAAGVLPVFLGGLSPLGRGRVGVRPAHRFAVPGAAGRLPFALRPRAGRGDQRLHHRRRRRGCAVTFTTAGWVAPGLAAALFALTAAAAVALRLGSELRTGTGVAADASGGLWSDVRTEVRRQAGFLGGLVLVFGGANAPGIFTGPRVAELGGSGWEIGLATAASALAEIPAYFVLPLVLIRLGGRRLFVLGGVLLGVSGLLSAVAPTPTLVIVARLFFGAGLRLGDRPVARRHRRRRRADPAGRGHGPALRHLGRGVAGRRGGRPAPRGLTGSVSLVLRRRDRRPGRRADRRPGLAAPGNAGGRA